MTAESPSLLLQRAADKLEQAAANIPAPQFWDREIRGADLSESGAAWAKLVGPPAAAPLVAWLRYARAMYEMVERRARAARLIVSPDDHVSESDRAAVEFARMILGVSAEGKERSDP